jgi:hypothetical protein
MAISLRSVRVLLCAVILTTALLFLWRPWAVQITFTKDSLATATIYENGAPRERVELPANSHVLGYLDGVIHRRGRVWWRSFITYAPVILIESSRYVVNIHARRIIMHCKDENGKWRQYVSDLNDAVVACAKRKILEGGMKQGRD